jgi:hypothetical protein
VPPSPAAKARWKAVVIPAVTLLASVYAQGD